MESQEKTIIVPRNENDSTISYAASIGAVVQSMCRNDYNVTVQPHFQLCLVPGLILACLSILLNIAVFLTFKQIRTHSALPSSRSAIHFTFLAVLDVFVGVAFVVSQIHAMQYRSYDDIYTTYATNSICRQNKTHHLDLLFTVFETSRGSGRLIKGYSILRYFCEMIDRFANAYIAIDRTLIVCFPMTYGLRKQRASDASSARQFFFLAILPPTVFTFVVVLVLGLTRVLEYIYEFYIFILVVFEAPIIPLLVCAIVLLAKSCTRNVGDPPLVQEGLRNLSQMTLALVVVFIACDVPNLVFQVGLWAGDKRISNSASPTYFYFNNVQHVARTISCFFHFFVYFSMSKIFRDHLVAMLRRYFCCVGVGAHDALGCSTQPTHSRHLTRVKENTEDPPD